MFPAFFAKVNSMGAPITGMIVLGVVQTAVRPVHDLADAQRAVRRAREPVGRHQRHSVRRVVVRVDGHHEEQRTPPRTSSLATRIIATVAMAYSVFALYASGTDAVMGGMLVLGITYVVWGFIAPRVRGCAASARARLNASGEGLTVARAIPERRTIMQVQRSQASRDQRCPARAARDRRRSPSFASRSPRCPRRRRHWTASGTAGRIKLGYLADARAVFSSQRGGRSRGLRASRCASGSPSSQDAALRCRV